MTTESLNQRLRDLVRYHRSELFRENLITEEEYADLVSNTPGSVDRLHDYDRVRAELAELKATVELHKVALANMTIERDLAKAELEKATHGLIAQRKMNEATHAAYHDVSTVIHLPGDNGAEMLRKVATERDAIVAEASMLREALKKVEEIACRSASGNGPEDLPEPANRDGEELADICRAALTMSSRTTAWLAEHDAKMLARVPRCDKYALTGLPGVTFCRKDGARIVGERLEDVRRETLNQFTVWLLKTHGLLIDESLLAPRAPETAPATPNEPPKALQPEDAGNFTHIAATATPYVCDICNTWHSAGEKPCPVPVDRER